MSDQPAIVVGTSIDLNKAMTESLSETETGIIFHVQIDKAWCLSLFR